MYWRMIKKDILSSRLITTVTVVFVAIAAALVTSAAVLLVNLPYAIDSLMDKALTPHFMQMHTGDMDIERFETFARDNRLVRDYQVLEFLNIAGSDIIIGDETFSDNLLDNGLSMQSEKFDFLLDLDNEIIVVAAGEIYAPLTYKKDGTIILGDEIIIGGQKLIVAGFLRDSQMNSKLSSSKRFLVNELDFGMIRELGNVEYLIEVRLNDLSDLQSFEASYDKEGLESNGPTITYPLFKLINSISEGIVIGLLLMVSILVILISFMCIRFTLMARIEDDYREIGVMKAIGLYVKDIKRIYLAKYAFISGLGCGIGLLVGQAFKGPLLSNIKLYMGEVDVATSNIYGLIGVALIFIVIVAYVNKTLARFKQISPVEAIRYGISSDTGLGRLKMRLSEAKLFGPTVFMGIRDVFLRKRLYLTVFLVIILATFVMIVPSNLQSTISSRDFVRYMGIGDSDILFSIQHFKELDINPQEISSLLDKDVDVSRHSLLVTMPFQMKLGDSAFKRINIELGDHSLFPVSYISGREPKGEDQISLSVLNAKELEVAVGDRISIEVDGYYRELGVSGIYSDITNGGKTAKANFSSSSTDIAWSSIYVKLYEGVGAEAKALSYKADYPNIKISDIKEYTNQTFGDTRDTIIAASYASIILAFCIVTLIVLLFMKMIVTKDRYNIAVLKALNYCNNDIRNQYIMSGMLVMILGIGVGTILANTLGEAISGLFMAPLGVSNFKFAINPLITYLIYPLILMIALVMATIVGTNRISTTQIAQHIKE